ncbi:MAG: asparagine synthase (glutamine-hydrolyzing) [Acidobacteria bacterium]|nr:asparagine synthase (glutamine-hydrolyzing) [Acidobacteriota bacterium]
MCGIAGFISRKTGEERYEREELLDAMCRAIAHRGPDDQGTVVRGRAALGMRRLAIIDLATGQQPIFSEDNRLAIVFNGEIYNYLDLKAELESKGYRFRTNSDTETILHAFEEYGAECVDHLRGMFAIAIWNFESEELFLARDRVGKKPLFYGTAGDGAFIFGSELKSLVLHPGIDRTIDPEALDAYLAFGYVPEHLCIFGAIKKLEPGHTLLLAKGKISTRRYWKLPEDRVEGRSDDEIAEELVERLREAVRVRLISEVPLGAFLSGGIDSSAVVGMMAELSDGPVKTFSIGFNEDSFNELEYARRAARHFKTDHHEFIVTPELVDTVDDIAWHFDEPFADSSALPTFMVAKLAREHVTVVLSGDGGDELFGGYTRYKTALGRQWARRLPHFLRQAIAAAAIRLPHSARGKNYLYNIAQDHIGRYIDLVSVINRPQRQMLYSEDLRRQLNGKNGGPEEKFSEISGSRGTADLLGPLMALDFKTYLPSDIMVKVDRMTMANSLEARSPLLDQELIEFAAGIPSDLKLKGGETKYILKKALGGFVPKEILYREKQGFGVPIEAWINRELRDDIRETLLDKNSLGRKLFDRLYIEVLLGEHSSGRRDHSHAIWALFMLEKWQERYQGT